MGKTETLCFELDGSHLGELKEAAMEREIDLEVLLQQMVGVYLESRRSGTEPAFGGHMRRKHPRKDTDIPAVLLVKFFDNETRCYPGRIRNISLGGLRVALDERNEWQRRQLENVIGFEVVFTIPGTSSTVSFRCKTLRSETDDEVRLAAQFEEANVASVREFETFLQ